jgi:hypothetical protein
MALDSSLACEAMRANANLEVTAAVTRAGVSRVAVAIVDHFQHVGVELRFELAANESYALDRHGAT